MARGIFSLDKKCLILSALFIIVFLGIGPDQISCSDTQPSRMKAEIVGPDYGPPRKPSRRHVGIDDIEDDGEVGDGEEAIADGAAIVQRNVDREEKEDVDYAEKAFRHDVVPFRRHGGRGREVVGAASSSEEVDKLENPGAVNAERRVHVHSASHRGASVPAMSAAQAEQKQSSQAAPNDAPANHLSPGSAAGQPEQPKVSAQVAPADAPMRHNFPEASVAHAAFGTPGKAYEQIFPIEKETDADRSKETHDTQSPGAAISSIAERLVPDLGTIGALGVQSVKMTGPHHRTLKHVNPGAEASSANIEKAEESNAALTHTTNVAVSPAVSSGNQHSSASDANAERPVENNPAPSQVTLAVASHDASPALSGGNGQPSLNVADVNSNPASTHSIAAHADSPASSSGNKHSSANIERPVEHSLHTPTQITHAVASQGAGKHSSSNKPLDAKLHVDSHSAPRHERVAVDDGAPVVGSGPDEELRVELLSSELEMLPGLKMGRRKRSLNKAYSSDEAVPGLEVGAVEDPKLESSNKVEPLPELKFGKQKRSVAEDAERIISEDELQLLSNQRMERGKRSIADDILDDKIDIDTPEEKPVSIDLETDNATKSKMETYWNSVKNIREMLTNISLWKPSIEEHKEILPRFLTETGNVFVSDPVEQKLIMSRFITGRKNVFVPDSEEFKDSEDVLPDFFKLIRSKRSTKEHPAPLEGDSRDEVISNEVNAYPRLKFGKRKRSIQDETLPNLKMGKYQPSPNLRMGRRKRFIEGASSGKLSPKLMMRRRRRSVAEAKTPVQLYMETKSERLATLTSEPSQRHQRQTQRSHSKSKYPHEFCELERDSGVICPKSRRGPYLEQFYYEPSSNRCYHFIYNGCGGNANRFSSLWECTQSCSKPETPQP